MDETQQVHVYYIRVGRRPYLRITHLGPHGDSRSRCCNSFDHHSDENGHSDLSYCDLWPTAEFKDFQYDDISSSGIHNIGAADIYNFTVDYMTISTHAAGKFFIVSSRCLNNDITDV